MLMSIILLIKYSLIITSLMYKQISIFFFQDIKITSICLLFYALNLFNSFLLYVMILSSMH